MTKDETRMRIEQAAIDLFNERGTAAVSTNHIAEAAEISPGNLYYHFRNKQEIIRAVFERMNASWGGVMALPRPDDVPPLTYLHQIVGATFPLLWEYRFFYREFVALVQRDPDLGQRYGQVRKYGLQNTMLILETLVANGVLRNPADHTTLPRLANTMWLIVEFWLPYLELGGESVEEEQMAEGADLLLNVLAPYLMDA